MLRRKMALGVTFFLKIGIAPLLSGSLMAFNDLSEKDQTIVSEFFFSPSKRLSAKSIAEAIDTSETTAKRRLSKLRSADILETEERVSFEHEPLPQMGLISVDISGGSTQEVGRLVQQVENKLLNRKGSEFYRKIYIREVVEVVGKPDFIIFVSAIDPKTLLDFAGAVKSLPGVKDTHTKQCFRV